MLRSTAFLKGFLRKKRFKSIFLLLVTSLFLLLSLIFMPKNENVHRSERFADIIRTYSDKYELPEPLIYAVIECESGFDENAVSIAGASGLMQLMPDTFMWISGKLSVAEEYDVFSPKQNINAGCWYLSYLLRRFKAIETALAAYNAGEGTVAEWLKNTEYSSDGVTLKVIPYPETSVYVNKVIRKSAEYEKLLSR